MSGKSKRRRRKTGMSGLALAEEATHTLRNAPIKAFAAYFLGTVPFVVALLFFTIDMKRHLDAHLIVLPYAAGLAVLFIWMKTWQSVFACHIRGFLSGHPPGEWTRARVFRMMCRQAGSQLSGFFLIPLSILLAGAPFAWAYAWLQNMTMMENGEDKALAGRAWKQALLAPTQNHLLIWLLSPAMLGVIFGTAAIFYRLSAMIIPDSAGILTGTDAVAWIFFFSIISLFSVMSPVGMIVALNIGILVYGIPVMMNVLLGIQTDFAVIGPWSVLNSSFIAIVFGLSYLVLDPVIKTAYLLRVFYGESKTSGESIRSELRVLRMKPGVAALAILFVTIVGLTAASGAPEVAPLDSSIEDVLSQREYAWQDAQQIDLRLKGLGEPDLSGLEKWLNDLSKRFEKAFKGWGPKLQGFIDWLQSIFPQGATSSGAHNFNWFKGNGPVLFALLVALCALTLGLILLLRKQRLKISIEGVDMTVAVPVTIEALREDKVSAEDLPSDEWRELAEQLLRDGELRLAMRAYYLGCLAALAHSEALTLARHKSNRDYQREVRRRLRDMPDVQVAFGGVTGALERVWYGDHPVDPGILTRFQSDEERIQHYARSKAR